MGKLPPLGASLFPALTGENLIIPGFHLKPICKDLLAIIMPGFNIVNFTDIKGF
jgi:hypothetical protein